MLLIPRSPAYFLRSILSAVFLFCCAAAPANSLAQHYGAYHKGVNAAERQIVLGHKDSALRLYAAAFRQYRFIFAKDAVNAAQIALRTARPMLADSFLLVGAASGLGPGFLAGIPRLAEYVNAPDKEALRNAMEKRSNDFSTNSNRTLAAEWDGRYLKEQTAKHGYKDKATYKVYSDIVWDNVSAIEAIWKARKIFPGHRVVGLTGACEAADSFQAFYSQSVMNQYRQGCVSPEHPRALYSIFHLACSASMLEKMLWEAVEAGMLHPREFAAVWEFGQLRSQSNLPYGSTNPGCKEVIKHFNTAWFHDTDSATLAEVERNRIQYWICPSETDEGLRALARAEGYKFRYGYY